MITTEWQSYDPARHSQCAGNYMFLLKPFQHAPYYAGETSCFDARFTGQHGSYFRQGFRTFMRPLFISEATDRTHAGFATAWDKANPNGGAPDRTRIHVARDSSDLADEAGVQKDIMAYYKRLLGRAINWQLPKRSRRR